MTVREGLGSEVIVHLEVDASGVDTAEVRDALEGGAEHHFQTITAKLPPSTKLHLDDPATLHVNTDCMHLFDLHSGLAIR